ncbi:DUF2142 domain-containing protein [Sanguibacter suaedae]|uniref:DUF2142 domain-containing protein n=1 Tax=Sanguibacter suaedae TaxID=2795737 RepID=A0A934IBK2_9MICO|nr:DUF2142 domain-containing protein [Sanguibacter suaedae]MBI9114780.1 DUF2142 domain-containing protein [Sanguibacter suaedae]
MTAVDENRSDPAPEPVEGEAPRWARRLLTSGRATPRRSFWWAFAAFFAVSGLWALSNPLMASVDEPAHVVKAAATVRGAEDLSEDGDATGIGLVELPHLYTQLALYPNCFAFQPNQPADCQQELSGDTDAPEIVATSAINYNPLYYALVGWPVLLPDGEHTVYAMRLVSALLSSALLAFAVAVVAGTRLRTWVGLAILLCVTPTVVNLLGSVNPQSVEVTGAVLLWVSLLALLRSPDPSARTIRLLGVVVGAVFVANARGLGPMLVVVILVACILSAPLRRTVDLVTDRRTWWALGASILACALGTLWILGADSLPSGSGDVGIPLRDNIMKTLGLTSAYVEQLFVALGWLDVGAPQWVIYLFVTCAGVLVVLGWAAGTARDRCVVAIVAAGTFAMPVVIHAVQADKIGFFWQGRYVLPVAIGVLLLSAVAVSGKDHALPRWLTLNVIATVGTILVTVQTITFYVNLHRYAAGFDGGWVLAEPLSWTPVPALVLTVLYGLAWGLLVTSTTRSCITTTSQP